MVITLLNIRITRADKNFFYRERHKKGIKTLSKVFCNACTVVSGKSIKFGCEIFHFFLQSLKFATRLIVQKLFKLESNCIL